MFSVSDRATRGFFWTGLPLCLVLYAMSDWSQDANIANKAVTTPEIAPKAVASGKVSINEVALNELSSALQKQAIGTDQNVTVFCPGDSIQSTIENANTVGQLNIIIDGTCTEDVTVMRDRVTFEGSANGGELKGTFHIVGARWTRMTNLTFTNPSLRIVGADNTAFTIDDSDNTVEM